MAEVSNRPPKQRGAWLALTLALIMHIALFAFLWIGVRWQNETPLVVEAEIWDQKIREAAPQPEPEPEPPKPVPVPEPVVKPPPPPPKVEEPVVAKPDIALEKEKKRKEQELKDKEQKEQLAKEKEQQQKLEQQKDKDQKLAKQKADEEAKKKADADKKVADQRKADDLQRVRSQAGGTGDAAKSQGPRGSPGYQNKIAAIIKQHTTFRLPDDLEGNPAVEYDVQLLPDGSVNGIRLIKSSNVPGFDDAVKDAINKSSPFPKDIDGTVPSVLHVSHKPKDQ